MRNRISQHNPSIPSPLKPKGGGLWANRQQNRYICK